MLRLTCAWRIPAPDSRLIQLAGIILATTCLLVAAPARGQSAQVPTDKRTQQVVQTFNKLVAEFNGAHDAQAIMRFFATDAVLSHAGYPDATYPDLQQRYVRLASHRPAGMLVTAQLLDVRVEGNQATLRILWKTTAPDESGQPKLLSQEKDLEVWTLQHGQWQLWRGLSFSL